jgi:large subunit ribosomal protein L23
MGIKLSLSDVIKRPHVTAKAYQLNQDLQQLVVEVHRHANKPLVAESLKKLFNVEVEGVRIINTKGRTKRFGRHTFKTKAKKKAIVALKEGYNINLMGEGASEAAPANEVQKEGA